MTEIFAPVVTWYMDHINYLTVTILMAIESSFIPFPSEIVVPPAAFKAAQGQLNIFGVIGAANLGAIIGALFNYYLAMSLGRKIVYSLANTRIARMMLVTPEGIQKAESFFNKYGRSSTFVGRLLPAIRQLISIPAGLSKMKMKPFLIYTILGSTLWNLILATMGYVLYQNKGLLDKYYRYLTHGLIVCGVLFIVYIIYKGFVEKPKTAKPLPEKETLT
jgi:membrane protein DedA with SNARE-associated domain